MLEGIICKKIKGKMKIEMKIRKKNNLINSICTQATTMIYVP